MESTPLRHSKLPTAFSQKRNRSWHCSVLARCLAALLAVEGAVLPSEGSIAWTATPMSSATAANGVARAEGPVTLEGMQQKDQWLRQNLLEPTAVRRPLSFVFGGKPSGELLAAWPKKAESRRLDATRTQHTLTWTDPKTGLVVRCVAVDYADYPAIEWTAYFKNAATSNTPILENIYGLDSIFPGDNACKFTLHGIKGDWCAAESYEPYHLTLGVNIRRDFAPASSGKSCDGPDGWPYYNLQMPGAGVLLAVGWPGQWRSSFRRDLTGALRVQAGQERTHLVLKPGEEIRTPLIAMLFWRGTDVVAAQNLWRRWYIAHNLPRVNGRPQAPVTQVQVDGAESAIAYVKRFLEAGIRPDLCWRDAGAGGTTWYPSATGPYRGADAWLNTGTWEIDRAHYPKEFKPFSDWVHAQGMQFVLWFEPERVGAPGSWLGKNHPEWLLPGTSHGSLLNLGNPAALNWLIQHVDGIIKSQGIDWYREDMNGEGPLPAWRRNDTEDRQGITENLYVQGHLAFWDELRCRNPGLRIDSCASGGRRNDLETMRRAAPLLRSDFQFPNMKGVVEGNQGHTYGLSFWLPFQGTGTYAYDVYSFRSFYLPSFGMGALTSKNVAAQKQAYDECRRIAPCMLGDYYPLTSYSLHLDHWIAWQFNRPEIGDGVVQAFRRAKCDAPSMTFRLRGLDQAGQYEVTNLDTATPVMASGKELMETGLTVVIKGQPGAAVICYNRLR